jgi:hypothetical protein
MEEQKLFMRYNEERSLEEFKSHWLRSQEKGSSILEGLYGAVQG